MLAVNCVAFFGFYSNDAYLNRGKSYFPWSGRLAAGKMFCERCKWKMLWGFRFVKWREGVFLCSFSGRKRKSFFSDLQHVTGYIMQPHILYQYVFFPVFNIVTYNSKGQFFHSFFSQYILYFFRLSRRCVLDMISWKLL